MSEALPPHKEGLLPTEQHAKITGYRKLTDVEIAFMNVVKSVGNPSIEYMYNVLASRDTTQNPRSIGNFYKPSLTTRELIDIRQQYEDVKGVIINIRKAASNGVEIDQNALDYGCQQLRKGYDFSLNDGCLNNKRIHTIQTGFMWVIRAIAKPASFV